MALESVTTGLKSVTTGLMGPDGVGKSSQRDHLTSFISTRFMKETLRPDPARLCLSWLHAADAAVRLRYFNRHNRREIHHH